MPAMHMTRSLAVLLLCAWTAGCGDGEPTPRQETSVRPERPFAGKIRDSIRDSTPDFLEPIKATPGSPNVLIILMDDVGYADLGCYGSEIDTPNIDRLAQGGLRYNRFTATAMCSPSRAALLTGLNHHSAGTGWVAEWDFGYPGYRGAPRTDAVMLQEILRDHGYSTLMTGKWHLTNQLERAAAGPYDSWPTNRGFERFWGFLGGEVSQWTPDQLVQGTDVVMTPTDGSFYLPDALTDHAIQMLVDLRAHQPDKPFFLYYATGATHAPHHTKRQDLDKYRGRYDVGWDVIRLQRLNKQKALGILPEQTRLTPNNPGVKPWDTLSPDQQRMYARFQENYAAFLDNLDQNVGRLVAHLERTDELDNTIIILTSDNGASREVGVEGSTNALDFYHYHPATTAENLQDYDIIGTPDTHPHYPHGWMQVSNTPFYSAKRTASGGGIRVPFVVHWPNGIQDTNSIRSQWHHVNDVMPTLLELLHIEHPATYHGSKTKEMEGTSMAYSFPEAAHAGRKTEQYYELEGHRGYYADGWRIVSERPMEDRFDSVPWQLYDLNTDFSESTDLAAQYPDKVAELDRKWWQAATQYGVLPLIDVGLLNRARYSSFWSAPKRKTYVYTPGSNTIQRFSGPILPNTSYTITAELERSSANQGGVIVALGDTYSGYSLYVQDNRLHYALNTARRLLTLTSDIELPTGTVTVRYAFEKDPLALSVARGILAEGLDFDRLTVLQGNGALYINDILVAESRIDQPVFAVWEGLDIGRDLRTAVTPAYDAPFRFGGTLHRVTYELE